ncbi:hypothetical protein PC116_g30841, partial [Phytophthora cactorum]
MNSDATSPPIELKRSSFDWSTVPIHFPAEEITPLPAGKPRRLPVQAQFRSEASADKQIREARRLEVKKVFLEDWAAYKKYAWMKDALKPISGDFQDQFSGWAATLVDSLDTLWIMGLREEFDEAVDAVSKIDFGRSSSSRVNTFETNIRYLGGLLATYDLSKRNVLRAKAIELGDLIYVAFNTKNRMPVDFIDFEAAKTGKPLSVESSVVSASPGTLSLELTRLSQLTGDPKYYDAAARVMDVFYRGQNQTLIPGLWPTLYEYLPKEYALLGGTEPKYEMMSRGFLEAAKTSLLFRP